METALKSEWSRPVDFAALPHLPFEQTIEATAQECKDLARRFGVESIRDLSARIVLDRPGGGHAIRASGTVRAMVVQSCAVTGEAVAQDIEEPFEAWYADRDAAVSFSRVRHEKISRQADFEVPMLQEREDPEPIVNGMIDIGEAASQFLSLAIDSYPRAAAADTALFPSPGGPQGGGDAMRNPFAALRNWKAGRGRTDGR